MKKLLLPILFIIFSNAQSAEYWVATGMMSGSADWVYALNANSKGQIFASSWAVGVYKGTTESNVTTWNLSGLNGKRVSDLFVAPNGDIYGYSHTSSVAYIHRSTDNGATWHDVYTRSLPNNYAGGGGMVFPADGSIVAAFSYTQGPTIGDVSTLVLKSSDGGITWVQKTNIAAGFAGGLKLLKDGRIFIGTSLSGVKQSTNNGESWINMPTFAPIFIHNVLQDKDDVIYVFDAYGPNRSTDNGLTFVDVTPPAAPGGYTIEASFVDAKGDIYLSYDNSHVFRSTNKGDTWETIINGLPGTTWICSFTEANGKVYAGTRNSGTFYLTDGIVGIQNVNGLVKDFRLKQNYPNPFNPSTTIKYELPQNDFVTLKVYNTAGNEVQTLVSGIQNAGSYSVNFDAASLPNGAYYYKLITENFSETKKMILLK